VETAFDQRIFANALGDYIDKEVLLKGWVYRAESSPKQPS